MIKKILPLIAIGTAFGAMKVLETYQELLKEKKVTEKDLDTDMREIQLELGRLTDLKVLNDKLEATGQISKINLSVNGVEINERIQELTDRIEVIMKIKKGQKCQNK